MKTIDGEGFSELETLLAQYSGVCHDVYVLFTGSSDPATGHSWCPDCVTADPVIDEAAKSAPDDAVLIRLSVGSAPFWKDPQCVFRTDPRTKLSSIPTLIKLNTQHRLSGQQITSPDLLEMFFKE